MRRLFALALFAQIFAAPILAPVFAGGATPALCAEPKATAAPKPPVRPAAKAPQTSPAPPDETAAAPDASAAQLDAAKQGLDQIATAAGNPSLDDAELSRQAAAIGPISAKIQDVLAKATPRQAAIKARLDQLGPAPNPKANPPVAPEDPAVAKDRADQMKIFTAVDDVIKRANLLELRGEQIASAIDDRRRALFAQEVFQSSSSIVSPSLWLDVARETPRAWVNAQSAFSDFSQRAADILSNSSALSFAALLLLLAFAVIAASIVAWRVIPRENGRREPNELRRVAAALWTAMAVATIPVVGVGALYQLFDWFGVSDAQLHPLSAALFLGVVRCALAAGLGSAILAPGRPLWRPVDLTDRVARRVMVLALTIAVMVTLGKLIEAMNEAIGASLQASVATRGLFALLVGVTLGRGLYGIMGGHDGAGVVHIEDENPWWPPIRFAAWAATFVLIVADLLGYVALAAFIVDQIVWAALIAALLFLFVRLLDEGTAQAFRPNSRFSRGLVATLGMKRDRMAQIGVLIGGAGYVTLWAIAILLVLAPWGVHSNDLVGAIKSAFFGIKVGDVTISLSSVIFALLLFGVGFALTRAVQNWLENRYLPLTQIDTGLRASIGASVGYLGVIAAASFAMAYLGINTEKLALVAGALSVGIGLGLQSVVNNFVSGLILLWERAIRVGDWVLIGSDQGYVRKISVRATEIETFDRATMIVPNGQMVTGVVKNFVRTDRVGRIEVPIQVIWGTDPERVREVLIEAAKSQEEVVGIPAPAVLFSAFTPTSLDFELVCFVEDVERAARVKSDLHYAIFARFAEAGLRMTPPPAAQPTITLDFSQLESLMQRRDDAAAADTKP